LYIYYNNIHIGTRVSFYFIYTCTNCIIVLVKHGRVDAGASYFCLLCCQTWQWNSVCVLVFVYTYMCGGGRVFVWDGCARGWVVCFVEGWRGGVGRQQPFGGRCARLIPARLNPHLPPSPSCFYTPIGRAHAHTGRGHTTTGKKIGNNNNKITRRFSPSVMFVRVSFLYTFSYFFFPPITAPFLYTCYK